MNSNGNNPFLHPAAIVEDGAKVGARTRVWAFAHILPGARIGADCNICDHVFIENNVVVGDRVTIKCGVYLWDGILIENDVHIGPCAAFTNDLRPRSRNRSWELLRTVVGEGSSIGANATILPGLTIGNSSMIAAGSVVTRAVPPFALVKGNPARFCSWVCVCGAKLRVESDATMQCKCGCTYLRTSQNKIERML